MKDEKKVVRSRFGVRSAFFFVVAVLIGRFCILMIVPNFRSGQYGLFLVMVLAVPLMFSAGILTATARLVVDEKGFSYRDLFRRLQVGWDEVTWIRVLQTGYCTSNISVYLAGRRVVGIPVSVMGNLSELENAMCRFAAAANPDVRITGH